MHIRFDIIRQRVVHPVTSQLFLDDLVLQFTADVKVVDAILELLPYAGLADNGDVKDRQTFCSGQTECPLDNLLDNHAPGE